MSNKRTWKKTQENMYKSTKRRKEELAEHRREFFHTLLAILSIFMILLCIMAFG
jgi:hypothetical protein